MNLLVNEILFSRLVLNERNYSVDLRYDALSKEVSEEVRKEVINVPLWSSPIFNALPSTRVRPLDLKNMLRLDKS